MSTNINSNFPSIHLIQSSIQRSARQQQIKDLTNQVKGNEDKITKIEKEIFAREKIIVSCEESKEAAERIKVEALKMIDYGQKCIKTCKESKEIIKEMIGIYETLIARNEASKAYSKVSECSKHHKAYTTPYDEKYEKAFKDAMDTSWTTESLGFKKQENIDCFNRISNNPVEKNYLFSMFTEWVNGFKHSSTSFFRWF